MKFMGLFYSLFYVEQKRVLYSHITWVFGFLTILTPLAGYFFYWPAGTASSSASFMANPALAGAVGGAVLFAMLTLFHMDQMQKNRTDALVLSLTSPGMFRLVQTAALLSTALLTVTAEALLFLPYTIYIMGDLFSLSLYVQCFYVLMLPSLWISILCSAGFYQLCDRFDLSFVLIMLFMMCSLGKWCEDQYLLCWVKPLVPILSDGFSNAVVFRTAGYSRMVWLLLSGGFYLGSVMAIRRYGLGLWDSMLHSRVALCLPIAAVCLFGGFYAFHHEPYFDHSPINYVEVAQEINEAVCLYHTELDVSFNVKKGMLYGEVLYRLANESGQVQQCVFSLNPGYQVTAVYINDKLVSYKDLSNDINNSKQITLSLPEDEELLMTVVYEGKPKLWTLGRMHFSGALISKELIDLGGDELLPQMDVKNADAASITARITLPEEMTLISTGEKSAVLNNQHGQNTWQACDYGSSLSLFAGDYVMVELEGGTMPIEFYYSRKYEKKMEQLGAQEVMENTIAYCTEHFGPLPFNPERPLKLIQGSAFLFGGQAFSNFSVMGEAYFNDSNLQDQDKGASSAEVLAHEIVHQWWGLSAVCFDPEESGWTDEGITTYITYRMMAEQKGEAYGQTHYVEKWRQNVQQTTQSFYQRHPEYFHILPEKYAVTLQNINWSTQLYSEMPLKIYLAAELLGGPKAMDAVLSALYEAQVSDNDEDHLSYITYQDFLSACGWNEEMLYL